MCACSVDQSHPTLWDPMDCSSPGSSVHGIFQARIVKWVATSSSRGSSDSGIKPTSPGSLAMASEFFTTSVQFSLSAVSDSLRPYGLQHARPPCPSPLSHLENSIIEVTKASFVTS